jgi:hypothetical protein
MAVRSALSAGSPLPQEDSLYTFLLEAESTPGPIVRLEELGQLKNPMTSSGIELATFRFVAQCSPRKEACKGMEEKGGRTHKYKSLCKK